jgi:hypothetical protein
MENPLTTMLPSTQISSNLVAVLTLCVGFITVSLLVAATLYLKLSWYSKKPQLKRPPKLFTWRVREIPIELTKEELRSRWEHTIQSLPKDNTRQLLEIPSLAPSSTEHQFATVICEEIIADALKREGWNIDKDFVGTTPLFDSGNAEVE